VPRETVVLDETESEIVPFKYSITSYGADYPVDSLVNRLEKDVVVVPAFQRKYIWTLRQASRFIESLLLGLPVPGIFLSKEPDSGNLLIIDGQQRLRTLGAFYGGILRGRAFALREVQPQFEGKTYKTLTKEERTRLDDSILHATIVRQDYPGDGQSSIYHIFERLNTGGTNLQPQEIRACIFRGKFQELLRDLNTNQSWRRVYGAPSSRLKDEELILRFFALFFGADKYARPMKGFMNAFMEGNRDLALIGEAELRSVFEPTICLVSQALGARAFRPERALNAAVFDAVMVATADLLRRHPGTSPQRFRARYERVLGDPEFSNATKTGTSDEANVATRLKRARRLFDRIGRHDGS
jgi:hypothetical protein